jgi:hypothetical protein
METETGFDSPLGKQGWTWKQKRRGGTVRRHGQATGQGTGSKSDGLWRRCSTVATQLALATCGDPAESDTWSQGTDAMSTDTMSTDVSSTDDCDNIPLPMPPEEYRSVNDAVYPWRRDVREELRKRGPITAYQTKRLETACLAMREAMMCAYRRKQKAEAGTITDEQWCAYSDRIVRYAEVADRALRDLGLDRDAAKSVYQRWIESVPRPSPLPEPSTNGKPNSPRVDSSGPSEPCSSGATAGGEQ